MMGRVLPDGADVRADARVPVDPLVITTNDLPPGDQFERWRQTLASVVDLRLDNEGQGGFPASQSVWDFGSMAFTVAELPGGGRVRSWRHLKRNPLDHWCLVLLAPRRGRAPLEIRSLARPFEAAADGDEAVLSLYMPRDLFPKGAPALDRLQEHIPEGPLTALLSDYILSLRNRLPGMVASELPGVAEATRQLIAACLVPEAQAIETSEEAIRVSIIDRARRVVRQNLARPDFGPLHLGRALGMSRSRLYRQFEPLGGVTRYIRRQRLLAAHAALSDPLDLRPVISIAESVGFTDASSFSRAFRDEFGYSPSDARLAKMVGGAAPMPKLLRDRMASGSLSEILAGLSV